MDLDLSVNPCVKLSSIITEVFLSTVKNFFPANYTNVDDRLGLLMTTTRDTIILFCKSM